MVDFILCVFYHNKIVGGKNVFSKILWSQVNAMGIKSVEYVRLCLFKLLTFNAESFINKL